MWNYLGFAALSVVVSGCESPNFRFTSADFGEVTALAAGGNLRLVTERRRALAGGDWKVVCSEPMPDYFVTFNRKADIQTQGLVVENPQSKASLTVSSDEKGSEGQVARPAFWPFATGSTLPVRPMRTASSDRMPIRRSSASTAS